MDDALVRLYLVWSSLVKRVLILVVMDDALVRAQLNVFGHAIQS